MSIVETSIVSTPGTSTSCSPLRASGTATTAWPAPGQVSAAVAHRTVEEIWNGPELTRIRFADRPESEQASDAKQLGGFTLGRLLGAVHGAGTIDQLEEG